MAARGSRGERGSQGISGASMVGACQTRRNASTLSVSRGLPGCNALAPRVLRERGALGGDAVVSQGIAGPGSRPIGLTTGGCWSELACGECCAAALYRGLACPVMASEVETGDSWLACCIPRGWGWFSCGGSRWWEHGK